MLLTSAAPGLGLGSGFGLGLGLGLGFGLGFGFGSSIEGSDSGDFGGAHPEVPVGPERLRRSSGRRVWSSPGLKPCAPGGHGSGLWNVAGGATWSTRWRAVGSHHREPGLAVKDEARTHEEERGKRAKQPHGDRAEQPRRRVPTARERARALLSIAPERAPNCARLRGEASATGRSQQDGDHDHCKQHGQPEPRDHVGYEQLDRRR